MIAGTLVIVLALYAALLCFGIVRSYAHLHLLLLVLQYFLLLPVILVYLRSGRGTSKPVSPPKLTVVALLFALVTIPMSWYSTRGLLNPDEAGYTFESRIFLSGHLKAPPLPGASVNVHDTAAEILFTNHVLLPDGWFPKFPPGWPMLLAIADSIHLAWLLTPILGVLSLVALAAIGRELYSSETGLLAACFAVLSPFYLVNSVGFMSHALCGFLSILGAYCLFRGLDTGRLGYFWGMFACLAYAFQVRPYTAFVVGVILTVSALWYTRENRPLALRIFGVGCVMSAVALGIFFLYNRLYTGHWLLSPYAAAAGKTAPPELTLRPGRFLTGIAQYGRLTFEESLFGVFPFAYLLAAYALFTERERCREAWILASIYLALVLAYLAHPEGSGNFYGERFHFEGVFCVFILAARGAMLLIERWHVPAKKAALALIALSVLQFGHQVEALIKVGQSTRPYRVIRSQTAAAPAGVVFLHDGPGFTAKHYNLNEADWPHSRHIFLIDADPGHRNEWACKFHVSTWTLAQYDADSHSAVLTSEPALCAAPSGQP